jgi:hypothetical protein
MARLIFLCWLVIPAVVFFAAPHGLVACGRGGGSTSSGSATTTSSTGGTSSAAAAMSAARTMLLSRSAMFRPYGRAGYNMSPGYGAANASGSGYGNTGAMSSSDMATPARFARRSQPSASQTKSAPPATDPAGDAPSLDLPSRDWVINGEKGDTVITAQFVGLMESNVILRKTDGHITLAPVDQLSEPDREYVAEQAGRKTASSVAKN